MANKLWLRFLRWRGWPKSRRLLLPTYAAPEKREILCALSDHAGFQYLMAHLENAKAVYEQTVSQNAIQAGKSGLDGIIQYHTEQVRNEEAIFWIGFLQNTVRRAGAMPSLRQFERTEAEKV